MVAGTALVLPTGAQAARRTATPGRSVNVRDFGALGDGVTDDTAAFNRATQAGAVWSEALEFAVFVPAGRYRIKGTVYVRKGQTLYGEGLSTHIDASNVQTSTFVLGKRIVNGEAVDDPGGAPVKISDLRGLGGAAEHGFIYTNVPGFQMSGLFLSASGLGLEIEAADGILSDIAIDMCLSGIIFRKSQNIVATNVNIYWPNFAITFDSGCRDITFSNSLVCYTKYAAVLFGDGQRDIDNVVFTGCTFTNNVQYGSFNGYVYSRASRLSALFSGCTFRNWPRHAVNQGAGVDISLDFNGCVFDGMPTNSAYDRSTTSCGISVASGTFSLTNCSFRNLDGELVRIAGPGAAVAVTGGDVRNCPASRLALDVPKTGRLRVSKLDGFAQLRREAGSTTVELPWWGSATAWRITARGTASGRTAVAGVTVLVERRFVGAPNVSIGADWQMGRPGPSSDQDTSRPSAVAFASGRLSVTLPCLQGKGVYGEVEVETVG